MSLPVYGCFLDASKAFDRVNHSIIFDRLLQHDLSPVITRALLNWYSDQNVCVSWNGKFSNKFSVSNGVRQGGVLSPILFTVYIDNLLTELEKKGVGCHWNNHFVGALCYTDDIALLAPSPAALRLMPLCPLVAYCLMLVRPNLFVSHTLVLHIVRLQLVFSSMVRSSI